MSDTFGRPWRKGLTDVAIGVAGIAAVVDLRGTPDALGRTMQVTEVAVADELASAAELVMGKSSGLPVAVVRGVDPTWLRESAVGELVAGHPGGPLPLAGGSGIGARTSSGARPAASGEDPSRRCDDPAPEGLGPTVDRRYDRVMLTAHLSTPALEAGLDEIRRAPADHGRVELIVRRPAKDERELLDEGTLDLEEGLVGDTWRVRGSTRTADGSSHPDMQLNVINARVTKLLAGPRATAGRSPAISSTSTST